MEEHIEAVSLAAAADQGRDGQLVIGPGAVALPKSKAEPDQERFVDQILDRVDERGRVAAGDCGRSEGEEEETWVGAGKDAGRVGEAAEVTIPEEDERGAAVGARRGVSA